LNDSYLPYKLTDELLVELIVSSKDPLLFKVLYERYIFKVFNTCLSFSNNNQEAEDICQYVFLKLLDKIHTFKGASKFSTWLYSFTYNHCVNYFHRNKIKKFEKNTSNIEQICNEVIAQSSDEDLVQMIKLEKLNEALELIPFKDKQILILKYQEFKSVKDLMDLHNAGESAIKIRLKRAKEKLLGVYNVVNCQALI
jgi:RNA polymerase sigma-70 factor (ECF subfamily)